MVSATQMFDSARLRIHYCRYGILRSSSVCAQCLTLPSLTVADRFENTPTVWSSHSRFLEGTRNHAFAHSNQHIVRFRCDHNVEIVNDYCRYFRTTKSETFGCYDTCNIGASG